MRLSRSLIAALLLCCSRVALAQEPAETTDDVVPPPPAAPVVSRRASAAADQPLGAPTDSPAARNPRSPVVTPVPGDFGLTFTFGGFGSFNLHGVNDVVLNSGTVANPVQSNLLTSIGARAVLQPVVLTFSLGLGVRHEPDRNDFGVDASFGVLRGFRAWRRIAPYVGGQAQFTYIDLSGTGNYIFTAAIGPVLGLEYFIADRVSLFAQGVLLLGLSVNDDSDVALVLQTVLRPGGQVGLNFYF